MEITNLEQSKHFKTLTERSLEFIAQLPWNGENVGLELNALSEFESQRFIMPNFTSLDNTCPCPTQRDFEPQCEDIPLAVAYAKSEAPAGLNLPNVQVEGLFQCYI